jgi:bifunctional UDP-N-acetylglucosamine pyrophosphorylase/glucosamine-1-phosphate N-acetyltransferase
MSHIAVVLAAGKGTRMKSDLPKVMHSIAGRSMLSWVLDAVQATNPVRTVVVVGHEADRVIGSLPDGVESCLQSEQNGTGHAVSVALDHVGAVDGEVLVVPGDTPLIEGADLRRLLDTHRQGRHASTILTAIVADPHGYGRIVRDGDGGVTAIVEQRDADASIDDISEINAGIYVFEGADLAADVAGLQTDNAQGEYYLTDVVAAAVDRGRTAGGIAADPVAVMGVNTHRHLAAAAAIRRERLNGELMDAGVHMEDPSTVYIDHGVVVEPGAIIRSNVHLTSGTVIAAGAVVGPDVSADASTIGAGARVWYSVLRGARVGAQAEVGPYVSLRPDAELSRGAKAGTFVEIKKSVVGPGAKVPHLSYIGDANIGARTNIGAGTITVNYNGFEKFRTEIGEDVKIGSDTMLVAPVTVGDRAMTAAGSVITEDVEADAMGFGRARQVNKPGLAARLWARYRGDSGQ